MRKISTGGSKGGLNRGAWTATEDQMLTDYITIHGACKWSHIPKKTDLKRCGKSCRLRWLNYLRPNIKRGNISVDEEDLIIRLHNLLGNRWSLIAGRLPGRTDNEIKNYWNTNLAKKAQQQRKHVNKISSDCLPGPSCRANESACTNKDKDVIIRGNGNDSSTDIPSLASGDQENSYDLFVDFNVEDLCHTLDSDLMMRKASAANQNFQHPHSDFISLVSFLDSDVQWPAINSIN